MPSSTPAAPPTRLSITDSPRNWSWIASSVAPTATRTPISRVRSVTETSITFMIPIPPTMSEIDAMATSSSVSVRLASSCAWMTSSGLRMLKSSSSSGRRWWRSRSSAAACWPASLTASCETAEQRMSSSQVTPLIFFCAVVYGQDDRVVLVLAGDREALRLERRDHLAGQVVHADHLADRVLGAEELVAHGAADHADVGGALDVVLRRTRRPGRSTQRLMSKYSGRDAAVAGEPVLVAVDDLDRAVDVRRDALDQRDLILDRDGVGRASASWCRAVPVRTPLTARPPASIQTKLSPRLLSCCSTRACPALPIATTQMTAAIPMVMPRTVQEAAQLVPQQRTRLRRRRPA